MQHLNYETADLFSLPKSKQPSDPNALSCVYAIINKDARKVYIGSGQYKAKGIDIDQLDQVQIDHAKCNRLAYHKSRLKRGDHPSAALQSDWLLYGDSFVFKVVKLCKASEALQYEELTIRKIQELGQYQLYNINHAFKF